MVQVFIGLVIGLAVGFVIGFLITRARESADIVRLRTRLEEREHASQEKVAELKDFHVQVEQSFKALAGDVLKSNSESFMDAARRQMEALIKQADGDIEKTLQPVSDALKRYEENLKAIEKDRTGTYSALRTQVTGLARAQADLQKETGNLINALRNPQTQGRWGEFTLRRTAELAGMSKYCDFTEQLSVEGDDGRQRPDMVVHLPAGRAIVVDSKAPLNAYVDGINAATEEERAAKFREHAAKVREHMRKLARRRYTQQFEKAPEFTVLFLPGENFFAAAVMEDPALIEDAIRQSIIPATPTTLVALLQVVAQGWREAQLETNARKISEVGGQLFDRISTFVEHLKNVGTHIERATRAYNQATGSFDTRLRPAAQRIKELGATGAGDLPELKPVTESARLPAPADGEGSEK